MYPYNNYNNATYNTHSNQNVYAYVNGIEGAKAYMMPPNQTVLLMDSDNPIFYLKISNALGQSSLRTFEFKEVFPNEQVNNQYVTKNELNAILERLTKLEGGSTNESN